MIALRALRGPNPGHFLAALGCLRVLTQLGHAARLRWEGHEGWLSPIYEVDLGPEDFAALVADQLNAALEGAWLDGRLGDKLPVDPVVMREVIAGADQDSADRLAAMQETWSESPKKTPLDLLGLGRTGLLLTARKLVVTPEHIARLMTDDARVDEGPTLRWDPLSVAPPAAYRGDRSRPVPVMLGAERLGLEALPLYPCLPPSHRGNPSARAVVTGWGYWRSIGARPTHARWRWSLWRGALDLRSAVALQQAPELAADPELHWCSRVLMDGYWSFAPAMPLPAAEIGAARRELLKAAAEDDWEDR